MRQKSNRPRIPRQQGYTLVLVLLLLGAAVGAALFSFFSTTKLTLESDQKTADALALAKTALIGRAVTNDDRPGSFPCPDAATIGLSVANDGKADTLTGNECPSYIGRLPWRTLGLPDLRDSSGERLWYALSRKFRDDNSAQPINSDTRGDITVYAADGTTQLTSQAVAVIFSPGPALGAQSRDTATTAACATTGTTIAMDLCAANYLETSAGKNNATTSGPFIAGSRADSYNDRVVYITTPEFMPIVEQRVAKELKTILQAYYNINGYFPFAAAYDDTSGNCAINTRRGRVPAAAGNCNGMTNWVTTDTDTNTKRLLPAWFVDNKWWQVMYYTISPDYGKGGAGGDSGKDDDSGKDKDRHNSSLDCSGGCLTVDGKTSNAALFFTPGTPLDATWRVPGGAQDNNLAHYLEDAQNKDGWGAGANDIYVTPTAKTFDRDRIYTLAGGAAPQQCANNAAALLALVPCGQPPKLNPQCSTLVTNLVNAVCSCAAAATQMINTPCQNTLNPSQCQSAVAALKSCTSGVSGHDSGHDSGKGKK